MAILADGNYPSTNMLMIGSAGLDVLDLLAAPASPTLLQLLQLFSCGQIAEASADHYEIVGTLPLRNGVLVVRIKIKVDQR